MGESYHLLYENRYQKAYEAGADYWGHTPEDGELAEKLTRWVSKHNLKGKRIIEFFCGEGASGVILSKLGCIYHGVDIAPSALQKAANSMRDYPNATVAELNVVSGKIDGLYDAALDVMGFHMLVTDPDRAAYLKNAISCLKANAPMFFFRELHDKDANDGFIGTFEEWLQETKNDYTKPRQMCFRKDGKEFEIQIPCVPGRSKTKAGYTNELTKAGFAIDLIVEMEPSNHAPETISIYAHKPGGQ